MRKKTFVPNWYLDKKNRIRDKRIKTCIMLVSIVNILLLCAIISISNKTKIKQQSPPSESNSNVASEVAKQDIITIEKYKEISDYFEKNNLNYKNIVITKSDLQIDIEVKSYEEYIIVIRCMENQYSIKKLTPTVKNESNFNFKVTLEV